MSHGEYGDFEFERRFWVRDLPDALRDAPALIVQSYFLADGGFGLRMRARAGAVDAELGPDADPVAVLDAHQAEIDLCTLTAKGPVAGGTRYEAEREIDPLVAVEMIRRGGTKIIKTRYSAWIGSDGWVIDVFGGVNHPLVIAECERSSPVTDLQIPAFCVTEVTEDTRFSNDELVHRPYGTWHDLFEAELAINGSHFLSDFGHNRMMGNEEH